MNTHIPERRVRDRRSMIMALVLAAIALALYVFGFFLLR
jgi:hypothetical protein